MSQLTRPIVLLTLVLALGGLASAATTSVHIQGFAFSPASITILAGDSVAWDNRDAATHTVTAIDGSFNSGNLARNGVFTRLFATPGSFDYRCNIHTSMRGTVLVVDPNAKPDLRITSFASEESLPGLANELRATVQNAGANLAPETTVRFTYVSEGGDVRDVGLAAVPALAPGASFEASLRWDVTGKFGDFAVHAAVDPLGEVAEEDESNNEADATSTVLLAGTAGQELP